MWIVTSANINTRTATETYAYRDQDEKRARDKYTDLLLTRINSNVTIRKEEG